MYMLHMNIMYMLHMNMAYKVYTYTYMPNQWLRRCEALLSVSVRAITRYTYISHNTVYMYICTIYMMIYTCYRMQNIVSFIGLFCKRDL